jgi:hypothetical protein
VDAKTERLGRYRPGCAERRMRKSLVTPWLERFERLRELGPGSRSEGVRRTLAHYDRSAAGRSDRAAL